MNRALRDSVRHLLLGLTAVILTNAVTAEEPRDPRLEKILADWQKRQNAVQSIDYQVEGEYKVPKGAFTRIRALAIRSKKSEVRVAPDQDLSGPMGLNLHLSRSSKVF